MKRVCLVLATNLAIIVVLSKSCFCSVWNA